MCEVPNRDALLKTQDVTMNFRLTKTENPIDAKYDIFSNNASMSQIIAGSDANKNTFSSSSFV